MRRSASVLKMRYGVFAVKVFRPLCRSRNAYALTFCRTSNTLARMAKKKQVQQPAQSAFKWLDLIWMLLVFALTCKVYLDAPQTQVTDSNYTILQTEQLLSRHTWMLDDIFLPNGVDDAQRKNTRR